MGVYYFQKKDVPNRVLSEGFLLFAGSPPNYLSRVLFHRTIPGQHIIKYEGDSIMVSLLSKIMYSFKSQDEKITELKQKIAYEDKNVEIKKLEELLRKKREQSI